MLSMSTWPINDQDPNLVTIDVGFIQQKAEFRKMVLCSKIQYVGL